MSKDLQVTIPTAKGRQVIYGEGKYIIMGETIILTINNITEERMIK